MDRLLERVRRHALQHALWTPATRVAAAVSGGSDSVALFFLLRELAAAGDLTLAGLVHLHHHIRGAAADEDAAFCRDLAARTGVAALVEDADIPALAAGAGQSLEVAGRHARQAFFHRACQALGADRVALAHTRDDQAETVLLRLVRGAGPTGLGGMAPSIGVRIRPVLEITRAELRAYLARLGEAWREDATNEDRANPRNRMRHEVLPLLKAAFNPQVDAALARTGDILRSDAQFLDTLASEAAAGIVRVTADGVSIDTAALAAQPIAVARRVALRALETANPGRSYGLEEADALCSAAAGSTVRSLPGADMERSGAAVVLTRKGQSVISRLEDTPPAPLTIPGSASGPRGRWIVTAEGPMEVSAAGVGSRESAAGPAVTRAVVDAAGLGAGLIVRGRLPGDRLQPVGVAGRKKVQDVFVDRKVPRDERDLVPIVTDTAGRIVWVAGHVLAEGFRVTPLTMTVVVLTLRRN